MSSFTRSMDGYFHRHNWFWLKPWLLSNSFSVVDHSRAHLRASVHALQACTRAGVPHLDAAVGGAAPTGQQVRFQWHHATVFTAAVTGCDPEESTVAPLVRWHSPLHRSHRNFVHPKY